MRIILASGSPRRREMLRALGLPYEVARPDIDETPHPGEASDHYVARLSREKNAAAASALDPAAGDALIITADTTVADGAEILGKPATPAEATAMLQTLRGRPHVVHTGITLYNTTTGERWTEVTTTAIHMRDYNDDEIAAYVAAGEPFDKAGAYGIQHAGFHPVERLRGCYANVMGLPMCTLCRMLRAAGVGIPTPITCTPDSDNGKCSFEK
jgi:septum formation protein